MISSFFHACWRSILMLHLYFIIMHMGFVCNPQKRSSGVKNLNVKKLWHSKQLAWQPRKMWQGDIIRWIEIKGVMQWWRVPKIPYTRGVHFKTNWHICGGDTGYEALEAWQRRKRQKYYIIIILIFVYWN